MGGSVARLFDTFNITGIDQTSASFTLPGSSSTSPAEASKQAAEAAASTQAQAIAKLQTAQNTASTQAQAALTAKRQAAAMSSDVFTSPLGLTTQAATAKKTLLGN